MKKLPLIMGIVNATPDSFSDGGDSEPVLDKALRLLDEGARIVDVGGESTRPGAAEIDEVIELERLLIPVKKLRELRPSALISIDTRRSSVAKVMLDLGVDYINDVSGLDFSFDMASTVAKYPAVKLIIMHSIEGGRAAADYHYQDVFIEVRDDLKRRIERARLAGVKSENLIIDPGLGFSKNQEENFALLGKIPAFKDLAPVLIGHSRKRFIRDFLELKSAKDADCGTLAVSIFAAGQGADILRVHNVKATLEALNIYGRCEESCRKY